MFSLPLPGYPAGGHLIQTTGEGSPHARKLGLFTRAAGVFLPLDTTEVQTSGYCQEGRGAALYVADAALNREYVARNPLTSFLDESGRGFRLSLGQDLNPFMAGATGQGDETLHPTHYVSDIRPGTLITQATRDGLAINALLRLLRCAGGGDLHIPGGEFRTFAYLERIDFPLRIIGAGKGLANIRNCRSSPTERDGYGILIMLPHVPTPITIQGLTLDGRALDRPSPGAGGEWRNLPLAVNGKPQVTLNDCAFINSPIDCMRTGYVNGDVGCWLRANNCFFSNSFRNTISLVSGWNQHYTNCVIEKGGLVHEGTNPKYCIDIEPGRAHETIKNVTFTNCMVREARNVVIGGVWAGNIRFDRCKIQAYGGRAASGARLATPWLTTLRGGEFTFHDCDLEYLGGDRQGRLYLTNPISTGEYANTQFVRLDDCRVSGAGIEGYGLFMELNNVTVKNSKRPVIFRGNGHQNVKIRGLKLINVFDAVLGGAGNYSSFVVHHEVEGLTDIADVDVRIDPTSMPPDFDLEMIQQFGISFSPGGRYRTTNIRATGYASELPILLKEAPDPSRFRDFKVPLAPTQGVLRE